MPWDVDIDVPADTVAVTSGTFTATGIISNTTNKVFTNANIRVSVAFNGGFTDVLAANVTVTPVTGMMQFTWTATIPMNSSWYNNNVYVMVQVTPPSNENGTVQSRKFHFGPERQEKKKNTTARSRGARRG
jgi:hypothetical protein